MENKCLDCEKVISYYAIRCRKCNGKVTSKRLVGKNNRLYIDGRYSKKYFCIDCHNEIIYQTWKDGGKRCRSCCRKGILSPIFGKKYKGRKLTKKTKEKIAKAHKGQKHSLKTRNKIKTTMQKLQKQKPKFNVTKIVKHHIYKKENSDKTTKMTRKSHRQLHSRAYDYIYVKYGKKGIDDYLIWFYRNFGGKI